MADYQVMPPLSDEEYAALKADTRQNGIRVPLDVDENGDLLDGHHRAQIAAELGIGFPIRKLSGLTEDDKHAHAMSVNTQRRQLTREQRRDLVSAELKRDPSRSDRAIARITGVDHKTVGAMRRGGWGIPQPVSPERARELTELIVHATVQVDDSMNDLRELSQPMQDAILAHIRQEMEAKPEPLRTITLRRLDGATWMEMLGDLERYRTDGGWSQ